MNTNNLCTCDWSENGKGTMVPKIVNECCLVHGHGEETDEDFLCSCLWHGSPATGSVSISVDMYCKWHGGAAYEINRNARLNKEQGVTA